MLLMVGAATPVVAAKPVTSENVSWTPRSIKVGAPCLFQVDLPAAPSSVKGKWQGRDLAFFSTGRRHVWYGLAGVDVEANPGSYSLEIDATMPDGQVLHTVHEIQVQPAAYKTV